MTDPTNTLAEPTGVDLIEHLFPLKSPATPEVAAAMDAVRGEFIALAHTVVALTPEGPDQDHALRELHKALMASIGNLAWNQPDPDNEGEAG